MTERSAVEERVDVVVIGGGFGGQVAATRLAQAGVEDVRILDAGGDFGGVWYWNRFPGAQCDTEAYVYLPLLEETGHVPTARYPYAEEIREHAQRIGRRFGLYERALFHTTVTEARWVDDDEEWLLTTDRGDSIRTRFLIRSIGALGAAQYPAVPGLSSFPGRMFHASRWDYEYTGGGPGEEMTELGDRRVAVIGSGATGVQVVTALSRTAGRLFVVQRTPGVVSGSRDVGATDETWYHGQPAGWQTERRRNFDANTSGAIQPEDVVRDQFSQLFRTVLTAGNIADPGSVAPEDVAEVHELSDLQVMEDVRRTIAATVQDSETARRLMPWFGVMCKRMTFDDGYLESFNRPNVTLIDAPVAGLERVEGSTLFAGGRAFDVDAIVFATGFDVSNSSETRTGTTIIGRSGRTLTESGDVGALHGLISPDFPNLFSLAQGLGGVNFTSVLDVHAQQIAAIVGHAIAAGFAVVEPTGEGVAEWESISRESRAHLLDYFRACTPGYYNGFGDLTVGTLTGQNFGGGVHGLAGILEDWRAAGTFEGLDLRRPRAATVSLP